MKKITLILMAAFMLIPFAANAKKVRKNAHTTGIVAHRGFWNCEEAGFARNSIAALRCAQQAGFWGSEFDVNMTADSVLIIYHDSYIDGKMIEKHPFSEFKDVRLENGEPIPTLQQYLEQGVNHPETMLVYELKPHSSPETEDTFVNLTIAQLAENNLLNPKRVMFISFSLHICQRLAEILPGYTVQFLGSSKNPDELDELGINGVDYNHGVFDNHPEWKKMARKNKMSINTWTVNSLEDIKKVLKLKTDQITTDQPLETRAAIAETKIKEAKSR